VIKESEISIRGLEGRATLETDFVDLKGDVKWLRI